MYSILSSEHAISILGYLFKHFQIIAAVNFAIQKGLEASKSRIEWFEHNDMVHLEKLFKKQTERDLMVSKFRSILFHFIFYFTIFQLIVD